MEGYVYILQSLINSSFYIGSTTNIKRRIFEHNLGQTKYTKLIKPFKLVYSQKYESINLARKIEYKLKKLKSRKIIEKIIEDKVIKLSI